jgi:hypothetical protein
VFTRARHWYREPNRVHIYPIQFCKIHFNIILICVSSRDSSDGIATGYRLGGLDGLGTVPGRDKRFFFSYVQTGTGAHPASCPTGTGGSFPWSKATGMWNWPLTCICSRGQQ